MGDPPPVLLAEKAVSKPAGIDTGFRTEHPHRKLLLGHFQGKHGAGHVRFDGDIPGDVQGESRFAHARSCGKNDQIRLLKPGSESVESFETRWNAGVKRFVLFPFLKTVDVAVDEVSDMGEGLLHLVLGNLENGGFGKIQHFVHFSRIFEAALDDLSGFFDEPSQTGLVLDDLGVLRRIDGDGGIFENVQQCGWATDRFQMTLHLQRFGQRDEVHRFVAIEELENGGINLLMGAFVKILRSKNLDNVR